MKAEFKNFNIVVLAGMLLLAVMLGVLNLVPLFGTVVCLPVAMTHRIPLS